MKPKLIEREDPNPIVAEVRRARESLLAKHEYDLKAMLDDAPPPAPLRSQSRFIR